VREGRRFLLSHALHRSVIGDWGLRRPSRSQKCSGNTAINTLNYKARFSWCRQVRAPYGAASPSMEYWNPWMAAKKYMVPLVVLHPYIGGGLLVEYFGHRRFDPARNALVWDSDRQLDAPMTREERLRYQSRLDETEPNRFRDRAVGRIGRTREKPRLRTKKPGERLQASATPRKSILPDSQSCNCT